MAVLIIIGCLAWGILIYAFISSNTPAAKEKKQRENELYGVYYTSWRMNCEYLNPKSGKLSFSEGRIYNSSSARTVSFTEIKKVEIDKFGNTATVYFKNGEKIRLAIILNAKPGQGCKEDILRLQMYVNNLQSSTVSRGTIDRDALVDALTSDSQPIPEKNASVIGRAVAGQIIAGPTGAVVGALSAVDKNNKNNSQATTEKDASVVGRAVAGQIIAGPAGAVVGALSAVDKNNKNKK